MILKKYINNIKFEVQNMTRRFVLGVISQNRLSQVPKLA